WRPRRGGAWNGCRGWTATPYASPSSRSITSTYRTPSRSPRRSRWWQTSPPTTPRPTSTGCWGRSSPPRWP
ncbi:MAG: Transcription termination protein NusB, partial [uncultured Propionibacteriaceae bacterium]